ncbi:MAG: SDR family NAD(P)-dependent oxidoreductase, partial [Christensenellales bacterium]
MKNVIVTGSCGGMGKATCELLLKNGYNVFALDYLSGQSFDNLECGGDFCYIQTDITNMKDIENAFNVISERVGHIDSIIHFAGIYNLNSLVEIDEASFIKIFDINLFGIYRLNKVFLPLLKEGCKIIITSSELAPLEP